MPDGAVRERLWDPLLRGFHWLLVVLVAANWLLAKVGPAVMTLHFILGYAVIGLVAFRLVWGFVGPPSARFAQFVRGPGPVLRYLPTLAQRRPSHWPGHSPVGALAVIAMLAVLAGLTASGLFADPEDYINVGPLADTVSTATARKALGWHHRLGDALTALVVLHVAVIAFYRGWKRENLVTPMLTGWKWVRRGGDRPVR